MINTLLWIFELGLEGNPVVGDHPDVLGEFSRPSFADHSSLDTAPKKLKGCSSIENTALVALRCVDIGQRWWSQPEVAWIALVLRISAIRHSVDNPSKIIDVSYTPLCIEL
jgi:hypothetical protein